MRSSRTAASPESIEDAVVGSNSTKKMDIDDNNTPPPSITPPPPPSGIESEVDSANLKQLESLLAEPSTSPAKLATQFHHYVSRIDGESTDLVESTNAQSDSHVALIPVSPETYSAYMSRLLAWRKTLKKGDEVDACDAITYETTATLKHHFQWFKSKVIDVAAPGAKVKDYKGLHELPLGGLKLSFKGFAARYDSWMGMDSELLTPMGSFREAKALVLRKRSKEKKARKLKEAVEAFEAEEAAQVAKEADAADTTDKVISRSGRVSCTKKKSAPAPKRKKVCKVEEDPEENPSWICEVCKEAECDANPDAPLLICEGSCQRTFHNLCVGLKGIPEGEWICTECKTGKHKCSACGEVGEDNVEGGVVKCSKKYCGLYFHESCVRNYNIDEDETHAKRVETAIRKANEEGVEPPYIPMKFTCPAHICWTCGDVPKNERSTKMKQSKAGAGQLVRCLYCPIAYHVDCIAPLAKFHELAMVCHDHCAYPLPCLPAGASVLSSSHATQYVDDAPMPKVANKFLGLEQFEALPVYKGFTVPPMVLPMEGSTFTAEQSSKLAFRIPFDIHDEVYQKPPKFGHLSVLKYPATSKPPRKVPADKCRCVPVDKGGNGCDSNCLNRMMYIECFGGEDKEKGRNCDCGPECGNRVLTKRQAARTRPAREIGMGWGLIALDDVKPGDLIHEYVGEVLTEKQVEERLSEHERLKPNDPNFYIMELQNGWYIDARDKGNTSRFINHSCNPNCQLERVNVGGYTRIAIMCIKPIKGGSFLSYDYQFDTKDAHSFPCACGSSNCRGTMKGGKSELRKEGEGVDAEPVKKSRDERLKDAKAKEEKDKAYILKVERAAEERLNEVGLCVPCTVSGNGDLVLSGPQKKYRERMRIGRIGLWRNAIKGYEGIIEKGFAGK